MHVGILLLRYIVTLQCQTKKCNNGVVPPKSLGVNVLDALISKLGSKNSVNTLNLKIILLHFLSLNPLIPIYIFISSFAVLIVNTVIHGIRER